MIIAINPHVMRWVFDPVSYTVKAEYWSNANEILDGWRETIINSKELVDNFFEGDEYKTYNWFHAKNPMLGGVTPFSMCLNGRENRLYNFIKNSLKQNE